MVVSSRNGFAAARTRSRMAPQTGFGIRKTVRTRASGVESWIRMSWRRSRRAVR